MLQKYVLIANRLLCTHTVRVSIFFPCSLPVNWDAIFRACVSSAQEAEDKCPNWRKKNTIFGGYLVNRLFFIWGFYCVFSNLCDHLVKRKETDLRDPSLCCLNLIHYILPQTYWTVTISKSYYLVSLSAQLIRFISKFQYWDIQIILYRITYHWLV